MSLRLSAAKEIRIVLSFTRKDVRCLRKGLHLMTIRKDSDATAGAALILLSQVPDPVTGTSNANASRESCREQKKDVLIKNMERKMGLSRTSVYYRFYFDGLKEAFNKDQLLISPSVIVLKIMLQAIFHVLKLSCILF